MSNFLKLQEYTLPQDDESKKNRNNRLLKPGAALLGIAAIATAGNMLNNALSEDEIDKHKDNLVDHEVNVAICDNAKIRDIPSANDNSPLHTLDFGDAPDGTCVTINPDVVYATEEFHDGMWYGMLESELAEELPNTKLDPNKTDNIVWVNEQKAHIASAEETK